MGAPTFRILIVDDEPKSVRAWNWPCNRESYGVRTAGDASEAWALFQRTPHLLVITDLSMPGLQSGLDLVRDIKQAWPETLILFITAHSSVATAVEAMRLGAHDFLAKPFELEMLEHLLRNAFVHRCLREENRQFRERLAAAGESPKASRRPNVDEHPGDEPGRARNPTQSRL